MKKLSLIFIAFVLSFSSALAGDVTNNGFSDPIYDGNLGFKAELDGGDVYIKWQAFSSDEAFKYYKVVRSQKTDDPVYPDHGYIKYESDIFKTDYIDYKPLEGTTYYRVCAITNDKNRYCSNVVKIYNEKSEIAACTKEYAPVCGKINGVLKTYSNKCMLNAYGAYYKYSGKCEASTTVCTMEYAPVCGKKDGVLKTYSNKCMLNAAGAYYKYGGKCEVSTTVNAGTYLSYSIRVKADRAIKAFILRVENKYSTTDKRIEVLTGIISKLKVLAEKKPKVKALVEYFIKKIQEKIDSYEDGFSEIEDIFNNY